MTDITCIFARHELIYLLGAIQASACCEYETLCNLNRLRPRPVKTIRSVANALQTKNGIYKKIEMALGWANEQGQTHDIVSTFRHARKHLKQTGRR